MLRDVRCAEVLVRLKKQRGSLLVLAVGRSTDLEPVDHELLTASAQALASGLPPALHVRLEDLPVAGA